MPGFVIGSPLSLVGEAWIGESDGTSPGATISPPDVSSGVTLPAQRVAFVYRPTAFGAGANVSTPSVRRVAKPAAWSNTTVIQTPRASFVVKSVAFAGGQSFDAARLRRALQPGSLANATVFFGPRLLLRIAAASHANASQSYTATVSQGSATKAAPHRASSAIAFAPAILMPAATTVTVTLSLPGSIARTAKAPARRAVATWPNLPKVAAPPWRLTVVTPDVARDRACQRLAAAKRAERQHRKQRTGAQTSAIVDALIDDAIAYAIVRTVAEDA